MAAIQIQQTGSSERQPSPILSSNNPFRNRTISPTGSIPHSPINAGFNLPSPSAERPTSRNPFLDNSEKSGASVHARPTSPLKEAHTMSGRQSPSKSAATSHTVELFDNLSLSNGPTTNGSTSRKDNPPPYSTASRPANRTENIPPKPRGPPPNHYPSRSQEERSRGAKPRQEMDVFADPPPSRRPRPRRNSESSVNSRMPSPEEERQRKERYKRDREARHRDARAKHKSKKSTQRLDIIDNLDVTSIYGKGLFHHDGPFDACNPDRNRKGSRRAPMEAFAKDSANNVIGGSGPVHSNIDLAQFHGQGVEGFNDYSTSGKVKNRVAGPDSYLGSSALNRSGRHHGRPGNDRQSSFNPHTNQEPIYGEESMGLGASTFLEGAPAAKAAIQRRESESDQIPGVDGGLGRKRSLAQRIRGISNANRHPYRGPPGSQNRVRSPDNNNNNDRPSSRPGLVSGESQSAGGMPKIHETKPFFQDYDGGNGGGGGEKKQTAIKIDENMNRRDSFGEGDESNITVGGRTVGGNAVTTTTIDQVADGGEMRARAFSSPSAREPLARRVTHDGSAAAGAAGEASGKDGGKEGGGGGGGFLSRVKSLKSGRRKIVERERKE